MSQTRQQQPRFDSVRAFQSWSARQPGRWELHDGEAVAMAPERAEHVRIKARAWQALDRAIVVAGLPCEALIDGMAVPGPGLRQFIPDVIVTCGDQVDPDNQTVEAPTILVEVLSPSTEPTDTGLKLESYFGLPSMMHYLIISSTTRRVIHHQRSTHPNLLTAIRHTGLIEMDPPGLNIVVEDLYRGLKLEVRS